MKILCYYWNYVCTRDLTEALKSLGHEVTVVEWSMNNLLRDEEFENKLYELVVSGRFDIMMSFNFLPALSRCAARSKIKYISWVYDSPNMTLYSDEIFNSCNRIFCFEEAEVFRLQGLGVSNVFYMPLAVNISRVDRLTSLCKNTKKYDISHVGILYENGPFDRIKSFPDMLSGYLDGIIRSQMMLYGCDIISECITDYLYNKEISKYVDITDNEELFITKREIFIGMLQKKVSSIERYEFIKALSERYDTTLFAGSCPKELDMVHFGGVVDYFDEMPLVFAQSKINLNITLRSIVSGIPLRCMDIMGAGGFLLSNYQSELSNLFVNGEEMVMFESKDDLFNKAEYYLEHDKEREEIAQNGYAKICDKYSYDRVLRRIFELI